MKIYFMQSSAANEVIYSDGDKGRILASPNGIFMGAVDLYTDSDGNKTGEEEKANFNTAKRLQDFIADNLYWIIDPVYESKVEFALSDLRYEIMEARRNGEEDMHLILAYDTDRKEQSEPKEVY